MASRVGYPAPGDPSGNEDGGGGIRAAIKKSVPIGPWKLSISHALLFACYQPLAGLLELCGRVAKVCTKDHCRCRGLLQLGSKRTPTHGIPAT